LPKTDKSKKFFLKLWKDFIEGYEIIRINPKLLLQLLFLFILQYFLLSVRLWISFGAIGKDVDLSIYLVLAPTTFFMSIFSFTPGNLGLRELIIGILSATVGLDFESGIFAGTIDRIVLMFCTFIFGGVSLVYIRSRISHSKIE